MQRGELAESRREAAESRLVGLVLGQSAGGIGSAQGGKDPTRQKLCCKCAEVVLEQPWYLELKRR